MADDRWGHCRECKFFGSPARRPLEDEEAACLHPVLSKYKLTVFGASGCNGWDLRGGIEAGSDQPSPPA
ncbi:MAG: hypothetical protein ACYDCL_14685 [Myxococcales bacterium]